MNPPAPLAANIVYNLTTNDEQGRQADGSTVDHVLIEIAREVGIAHAQLITVITVDQFTACFVHEIEHAARASLRRATANSKSLYIFGINSSVHGGEHWCIACLDLRVGRLVVFNTIRADSALGLNTITAAERVLALLSETTGHSGGIQLVIHHTCRQKDGWECLYQAAFALLHVLLREQL